MNYEKVSVNIDDKKLAQIDMLVENDFYANRSDFINQAVSRQLDTEAGTISGILNQKSLDSMIVTDNFWFIGIQSISRDYLTRVKELGAKINVKGFGIVAGNGYGKIKQKICHIRIELFAHRHRFFTVLKLDGDLLGDRGCVFAVVVFLRLKYSVKLCPVGKHDTER